MLGLRSPTSAHWLAQVDAGLIEARSCEQFPVLADHVSDAEFRRFCRGLFESGARHHATYVRLACGFAPEAEVRDRLGWLAAEEATILAAGDPFPRMHSEFARSGCTIIAWPRPPHILTAAGFRSRRRSPWGRSWLSRHGP
ncbi:MAG: tRNA isopentenyl-2-thiomethyl-A-37 hydroxylase MiaE [Planctomycetaceae bacterium]